MTSPPPLTSPSSPNSPTNPSPSSFLTTTTHPLPPPPAQWTLDTLPHLERASLLATPTTLIHALDRVAAVLDAAGIPWALMGGLALLLHGFRNRTTRDVDVAVGEGVRARRVIEVLGGEAGVYSPPVLSVVGSGCGRFYVVVGGKGEGVVEVDVILAGHLGAPKTLAGATTTKTAQTAAGLRSYNVLSVQQLCRAKLHALYQREAERDFGDLEWLCMNFAAEVGEAADTCDEEERASFVAKYRERYPDSQEVMINGLMAIMGLAMQEGGD